MVQKDRTIIICCDNEEEMKQLAKAMHNQMVGNPDYIESKIVLHYSDECDADNGEPNSIWLFIDHDVTHIPTEALKYIFGV